MKRSMADSNLAIINDLKNFLEEISFDSVKRLQYIYSPAAFTRKRILCFKTMVLIIINIIKRSLSIELACIFEDLPNSTICSKQAFSKGRRKLNPIFFHHWNDKLVDSYYLHHSNTCRRWKGFQLWAVDGTCLALPDTAALKKEYGCASSGKGEHYLTCRASILYDVLNEIIIKGELYSYHTSEHTACLDLLKGLDLSRNLLLFDRGYPSYWMFHLLLTKGTHFVFRTSLGQGKEVKAFFQSRETDKELTLYPSYKSIKKMEQLKIAVSKDTGIKVRLIKVQLDTGETEVLVTNLLDTSLYPRSAFKALYHLKWGIETCYGYLKEELQLQQFSGTYSVCIQQDFAATLFFYNLQSLIQKQCEPYVEMVGRKRKHPYKVNKNISWAFFKNSLTNLLLENQTGSIYILNQLEKTFCRYLEPVRPGRKYTRVRKRGPDSKYYTFKNYKRAI